MEPLVPFLLIYFFNSLASFSFVEVDVHSLLWVTVNALTKRASEDSDWVKRSRQVVFFLICQAKFIQARTKSVLIAMVNLFHLARALGALKLERAAHSLYLKK